MLEFIELLEIEGQGHKAKIKELLKWGSAILMEIERHNKRIEEIKSQIEILCELDPIPEDQKIKKETLKLYALQKI